MPSVENPTGPRSRPLLEQKHRHLVRLRRGLQNHRPQLAQRPHQFRRQRPHALHLLHLRVQRRRSLQTPDSPKPRPASPAASPACSPRAWPETAPPQPPPRHSARPCSPCSRAPGTSSSPSTRIPDGWDRDPNHPCSGAAETASAPPRQTAPPRARDANGPYAQSASRWLGRLVTVDPRIRIAAQIAHKRRRAQVHPLQGLRPVHLLKQFETAASSDSNSDPVSRHSIRRTRPASCSRRGCFAEGCSSRSSRPRRLGVRPMYGSAWASAP